MSNDSQVEGDRKINPIAWNTDSPIWHWQLYGVGSVSAGLVLACD
jgi:hypothetical protein